MKSKLRLLKEYFNSKKEVKTDNFKITEISAERKGSFVPSSAICVNSALKQLIEEGDIDDKGLFLDAGCGDGRIIALTAGIFNIPSLGVEFDAEVSGIAEKSIDDLSTILDFKKENAVVIKGDFTEDNTYEKAGIRFEDIKTVFNYINNSKDIAKKIAEQSPEGTVFLLLDTCFIPMEFPGLKLEKSLKGLADLSKTTKKGYYDGIGNLNLKFMDVPYSINMYVYRK